MRLIDADKARKTATIDLVVHHLDRQPTVAAVPIGAVKQIQWERDVAIEQLNSYGISFGERADCVNVVRCKDCKHYSRPFNWPPEYTKGKCMVEVMEKRVYPDHYCAYGERKDGES